MAGEVKGEQQGEQKDRTALKSAFLEGKKPTEQDFADVFESFLNLDDEGITIDQENNLEIEGSVTVTGNIIGKGDLTINGLMNSIGAKGLVVSGEIQAGTLKVGGEVVEQIWEKTDAGTSFEGEVSIGDASINQDGSASFANVQVQKLSIGDDEWDELPKELWKETQPGNIKYDGTVTIAGENPELVLEGKASIDEIVVDEITLAGKPLLPLPSEWKKENDNLQYLGTVEVQELKLLGAIADSSFSDLEEATTFLENQSNIELKAHIASLHGILKHLIDEVKDLKTKPIEQSK